MNKKMLLVMGGLLIATHLKAQVVLEALDAPDTFTPSEKCLERVYDKHYGDGDHNFIYCAVMGPNGKKWLNLNLGAEYAREGSPHFNPEAAPIDHNDWKAYGSLFQYGRRADGHELVTYHQGTHNSVDWWYVDRKYPRKPVPQENSYTTNNAYVSLDHFMPWAVNFVNLWDSSDPNKYAHNPCPEGYEVLKYDELRLIIKDGISSDHIIKGERTTSSVFIHKDYPNIHLVTAPYSIHKEDIEQGMERTLTPLVNAVGATSGLWLMGVPAGSDMLFGDVNDPSGRFWQYNIEYEPVEIGYLDRGIFRRNLGIPDSEYGVDSYEDFPRAEGYSTTSDMKYYFSLPIRCVEKTR